MILFVAKETDFSDIYVASDLDTLEHHIYDSSYGEFHYNIYSVDLDHTGGVMDPVVLEENGIFVKTIVT